MNPPGNRRDNELRTQTQRPQSSLSNRPSSALSRPSSRPSSRISQRPQSSLTARPPSSASQRAQSRISNRPQSRNSRTKLLPHCQALVRQVVGSEDEDTVEDLVRRLESVSINKPSASVDMSVIDSAINGHALKARVNLNDRVAQGLEHCYRKLKAHLENQENDLDAMFMTNRMPDHLQLLIALSQPPSSATLAYASLYTENASHPTPSAPSLTWAEILAEEPFEGDHWEGVMDPITVKDDWDTTPSLSPLNSDDLALDDDDDDSSLPSYDSSAQEETRPLPPLERNSKHVPPFSGQQLDNLRNRQYWRNEWRSDADPSRPFVLGDPSTLGPAAARPWLGDLQRFIDELDMVREVLIALQGRENIVYAWERGEMRTTPSTPRLIHLSPISQASILSSLGKVATTIQHLRTFVAAIFSQSPNRISLNQVPALPLKFPPSKTAEAFADAVDGEIRRLETWTAKREEEMCKASLGLLNKPLVVSLLSTDQSIRDEFDDSFEALSSIVKDVFGYPSAVSSRQPKSPATLATALLDTLFSLLQEHVERKALATGDTLMRVFIASSEPVWGMTGQWLRNGMSVNNFGGGELEEEFFIEYSGIGVGRFNMGLTDPDFWKEGYSLREATSDERRESVVPKFLKHVADLVLGTGKAIGLVRALGLPPSSHGFAVWQSFKELIHSHSQRSGAGAGDATEMFSVSVDSLAKIIYDHLRETCEATGAFLSQLLVEDCDLWSHVNAIEDLFLMRRGDAITHFLDVVFSKMDLNQSWGDFHFLNTAFGDVVRSNLTPGMKQWIQLSLVRFAYRGSRDRDKEVNSTLKAINGLSVEYAVPYPLTYIFRPEAIQTYSEIFVFLFQLRRAKYVLERILMREEHSKTQRSKEELKLFYAIRSRLSWFTNTFLGFITTHVLQIEITKFHEALSAARSLDEIVTLHDQHLNRLQERCMLSPSTTSLHKAIISLFDICLHFTNVFITFAGDTTTTHDVSRQSITLKHRSRRQRKQRRNVIGFAASLRDLSSDEDNDEDDLDLVTAEGPSMDASQSFFDVNGPLHDGDFFGCIERVSRDVDGLVRYIRRGVDTFAGGTTEAAPAFGVLAFALEDWDL